jgi:phosphoglycerol geranylgeranyltransferase
VPYVMVEKVRKSIEIPLIVGGGLREYDNVKKAFDSGADFVVLGSIIERSRNEFTDIMRRLQ